MVDAVACVQIEGEEGTVLTGSCIIGGGEGVLRSQKKKGLWHA